MKKIIITGITLLTFTACGGPDVTAEDTDGVRPEDHRIFVSSASYTGGSISSQKDADSNCTSLAEGAGLVRPYKAILSTQETDANDHIDITGSIYIFTDSKTKILVASSVTDLWAAETGNLLLNAVNRDESYNSASGVRVWTGTTNNGGVANDNCSDWTSTAASGWYGNPDAKDDTWLEADTASCNNSYRIYCISQ